MASSGSKAVSGLLKIVFLAHLVLSSWGMESPYQVPTGYLYYNLIFMISLLWAVASDNTDSVSMAFLINIASIVMDAFALSFWPGGGPSRERVYFGLAIANAVLRAVTALLLYRLFKDRDANNEGLNGVFGGVFNATGESDASRKGYESIGQQDSGPSGPSQPQQDSSQARGGGGKGKGTTPRDSFA